MKSVFWFFEHELQTVLRDVKADPDTIVLFTNGCFDLLHVGHVYGFAQAAQIARARTSQDKKVFLVVGLNSDRSVHELKGADRPFFRVEDRAFLLSQLRIVDCVVLFDSEEQLDRLHGLIKPDFYFKGGDYADHPSITSRDNAFVVPRIGPASSSALLKLLNK